MGRGEALADLREILLGGLKRGLVGQVNTSALEFESQAEDFTQEALLKVLANLDTFRGNSKFTTWAHKIAVRIALSELRRKRWQDRSLDELVSAEPPFSFTPADNAPTPAHVTEQRDVITTINRIIANDLTDKQREAMQMVPLGGMPIQEAANQLGMNRNALYKLLHDARKRIRDRLAKEGLSSAEIIAMFEK